jgi:transposase
MTLEEALEENKLLRAKIAQLEALVAQLQDIIQKNSRNSSKPPSSDSPSVIRPGAPKSHKKQGGQPGHKGQKRELFSPEQVDHFIPLKPFSCKHCHSKLTGNDAAPFVHQVVELPRIKPIITEYQLHKLTCSTCGESTRAALPKDASPSQFGPRLSSLIGLLGGRYHLSRRMNQEILSDVLGIELSLGSVSNVEFNLSEALAEPVREAHEYAKQQTTVNADETGFRQEKKKATLWVLVTHLVTIFQIFPNRGKRAAQVLLGDLQGRTVGTDRWASYHWLGDENRQICLEHLKRDFIGLSEKSGKTGELGTKLADRVKKVLQIHREYKEGFWARYWYEMKMKLYEKDIGNWLRECKKRGTQKAKSMCSEILQHEKALWNFVKREGVEPTNNAAERALRPAVIWRKISFGSESERGSRFVERILSVVTSLRQQGKNVLEWLTSAYEAHFSGKSKPSLLLS